MRKNRKIKSEIPPMAIKLQNEELSVEASSSDSETDLLITMDDSETGSESSESHAKLDEHLKPKEGDYVLVKYEGRRKVHYIGRVTKEEDEEGDLEISFLKVPIGFIESTVEDVHSVPVGMVIMMLPQPVIAQSTKRMMGIRKFSIDFSVYDIE